MQSIQPIMPNHIAIIMFYFLKKNFLNLTIVLKHVMKMFLHHHNHDLHGKCYWGHFINIL